MPRVHFKNSGMGSRVRGKEFVRKKYFLLIGYQDSKVTSGSTHKLKQQIDDFLEEGEKSGT